MPTTLTGNFDGKKAINPEDVAAYSNDRLPRGLQTKEKAADESAQPTPETAQPVDTDQPEQQAVQPAPQAQRSINDIVTDILGEEQQPVSESAPPAGSEKAAAPAAPTKEELTEKIPQEKDPNGEAGLWRTRYQAMAEEARNAAEARKRVEQEAIAMREQVAALQAQQAELQAKMPVQVPDAVRQKAIDLYGEEEAQKQIELQLDMLKLAQPQAQPQTAPVIPQAPAQGATNGADPIIAWLDQQDPQWYSVHSDPAFQKIYLGDPQLRAAFDSAESRAMAGDMSAGVILRDAYQGFRESGLYSGQQSAMANPFASPTAPVQEVAPQQPAQATVSLADQIVPVIGQGATSPAAAAAAQRKTPRVMPTLKQGEVHALARRASRGDTQAIAALREYQSLANH